MVDEERTAHASTGRSKVGDGEGAGQDIAARHNSGPCLVDGIVTGGKVGHRERAGDETLGEDNRAEHVPHLDVWRPQLRIIRDVQDRTAIGHAIARTAHAHHLHRQTDRTFDRACLCRMATVDVLHEHRYLVVRTEGAEERIALLVGTHLWDLRSVHFHVDRIGRHSLQGAHHRQELAVALAGTGMIARPVDDETRDGDGSGSHSFTARSPRRTASDRMP